MKNILVKGIAAAFIATCAIFSTSANAADLGSYKGGSMKDGYDYKPEVWKGFYIGGHVGGSWGEVKEEGYYDYDYDAAKAVVPEYYSDSMDVDGVVAGVHVGYNFQHQNAVFGIEGDYSWSGADGDDYDYEIEADYLASLRGRLGYAMGNTHIYATGGVAWTRLEDNWGDSLSMTGYVFGAGLEHKFSQNLSGRVEVLHYGFDKNDIEYDPTVVRAGLTYHFN